MDWISVKDRLPENDEDVLVYNSESGIYMSTFYKRRVSSYDSGWDSCCECGYYKDPTHWIPLPKAPEK